MPFVVTFATPKFCASRTCGPVVDVEEEVQHRLKDENVRFIHVEVYEDNDPAKGYNQWMKEWNLPTEPWTFLVDAHGTIVERFEGTVSVDELETAVREKLLPCSVGVADALDHDVGDARLRAEREDRPDERDDVLGARSAPRRAVPSIRSSASRRTRARSLSRGRRAPPPRGSATSSTR